MWIKTDINLRTLLFHYDIIPELSKRYKLLSFVDIFELMEHQVTKMDFKT
jgi:hypothetical protein